VQVGVDTGGTFTDLVAADGRVAKVLSTPEDPAQAIREALGGLGERPDLLAHGTTVATNALLERRGATVALVTTEGLRDVIEIARQDRPSLYDTSVVRPDPLVPRGWRLEVVGRVDASGREVARLDLFHRKGEVELAADRVTDRHALAAVDRDRHGILALGVAPQQHRGLGRPVAGVEAPAGVHDRRLQLVDRHKLARHERVDQPEHERLQLARAGAGATKRRVGEEAAALDLAGEVVEVVVDHAPPSIPCRSRATAAARASGAAS